MKRAKVLLGPVTCTGSTHYGLSAEPRIKICGDTAALAEAAMETSPAAGAVVISPCLGEVALAAHNDNCRRKAELVEELSGQSFTAPVLSSDCAKTAIPSLRRTRLRVEGSVPRILALKKRTSTATLAEAKALNSKDPESRATESRIAQLKTQELRTREPKTREPRPVEPRIPEVKPPSPRRSEAKSLDFKAEKPKRPARKIPKADDVLPEPIKLETLAERALEPERPVRLEIPAHVAVKVIPTPRKRETKQAEAVVQPPPELPATRPLKVIRKRREEAPKVFETIATSVPQAMLAGIATLRDEGEPK
ncbi:MAG: hypothetical protein HY914_18470 [Desulfomonile tiedjei]|nr:hypothetical protein [Desulfomonile tiedjei]